MQRLARIKHGIIFQVDESGLQGKLGWRVKRGDACRKDEDGERETSKILDKPTKKHTDNQDTAPAHKPAKQQKDIASNMPANPPAANPTPCTRLAPSSVYGTVCMVCVCVCGCVKRGKEMEIEREQTRAREIKSETENRIEGEREATCVRTPTYRPALTRACRPSMHIYAHMHTWHLVQREYDVCTPSNI